MSQSVTSPTIAPSAAEQFFGLTRRPFSLTPDLRFAYHSRSHTHALEEVTAALRRREGLIVVTGAIGTGKTMLCRTLLENFEARTFLSLILDPGLDAEDLLRQVLIDFGILGASDGAGAHRPEVTRHQFVEAMHKFLASLVPLQAHAVIMIDEAQHLSPRVLEEIRLLTNFETDEAKLLQIVLVGQPDLDELLRRPIMQQLNQRVARRCQLHPLAPTEVADYIDRRLTVATADDASLSRTGAALSAGDSMVKLSPAAARSVATISAGIPRVINTLCDRALDVAYERQVRRIEPDVVLEAASRLQLDVPGTVSLPLTGRRRIPNVAAAAALVVVLGAIGWWWIGGRGDRATTSPTQARPGQTGIDSAASGSGVPPAQTAAPAASEPAVPGSASTATPGASPAGGVAASAAESAPASAPSTRAVTPAVPAAGVESFVIAVAAFRTEARAQAVAQDISALSMPATVRLDTTGSWYSVVAGPFASSEDAAAAQEMLTRSGYAETRMSRATP